MRTVANYEPNEWNTGDIITAEKLNHIEYGINNTNEFIGQLDGMKLDRTSIVPGAMFDYVTVNPVECAVVSIFSSDTNSYAYGLWFHESGTGRYVPILATGSNLTITANNGEYAGLTIKNKSTATAPAYVNIMTLFELSGFETSPSAPFTPIPADQQGEAAS